MTYLDCLDVGCSACGVTYTRGELHVCPAESVHPRPRSLHPMIGSFIDLQDWLEKALASVDSDLGDGETMQSLGRDGEVRLKARRAAFLDVAFAIAPALAEEYDAREADRAALSDPSLGAGGSVEAYRG